MSEITTSKDNGFSREYISSIDVLRTVSMLEVITLHYVGNIIDLSSGQVIDWGLWFLKMICFCAVNIFGLISGFLGCGIQKEKNEYLHSSIVNKLVSVFVWCGIITTIGIARGWVTDTRTVLLALFPFLNGRLGYVWAYAGCILFIPYMNFLFTRVEEHTLRNWIVILTVLLSIARTVVNYDSFGIVGIGMTTGWLMYLYLIGGYIRKYRCIVSEKRWLLITVIILNSVITILISLTLENAESLMFWRKDLLQKYTSPLMVGNAVCMLLLFRNIKVRNELFRKLFRWSARVSFGVYVIHAHPLMLDNIFYVSPNFAFLKSNGHLLCPILIVLTSSIVFICCGIAEQGRMLLFRLVRLNQITKKFDKKVDQWLSIQEKEHILND